MQSHAGRHKQKMEFDLTTVTVPVVYSFLSGDTVSAATVAVTMCNPCSKAVGQGKSACLAGLPSQGFFKYANKKEAIPNFLFVCFLNSKAQY